MSMAMSGADRKSPLWFIKSSTLFEETTDSIANSVARMAVFQDFDRNDLLNPAEDADRCIFMLMEGQVKLRLFIESGKEIITDVAGPGDCFGPLAEVLPGSSPLGGSIGEFAHEAVAMSSGSALRISLDEFRKLVERRPTVVVNLTRMLGIQQRRLEFRLARLLYRSSLGKVAGLVSELGERYGVAEDGHVSVGIRLTQQEMASIIGAKRETVTDALAELELRGFIRANRRGLTILDREALDRIM